MAHTDDGQPARGIRETLTAAEREVIAKAEVYHRRSLTDREIHLGLEQARALGELPEK